MTNKYGPWIAFNEGDTPPADDVMVQVQLDRHTREYAATLHPEEAKNVNWTRYYPADIVVTNYRILQQPVRGEVVMIGNAICLDKYDNSLNTHRVTFPTIDGQLIPGAYTGPDGAQIKIEAL